jgi:enoyl-CoA hydratase
VYLSCPATPLGEASVRLAWKLVDTCSGIEERDDLPAAVVLRSNQGAFWLEPPQSAADCDAPGEAWAEATAAVARLTPPTIAAIDGDAVGPAWELALACDLRVATHRARVGSPEVLLGRIPAGGGTQRLTRLVGPTMALRMLLLGEPVSATDAYGIGLIDRLADDGQLDTVVEELVASLRAAAPVAAAYVKESVKAGADLPLGDGLRLEADLSALLQTTADRSEGIRAFVERREPRFTGQ